ncbi:hypothetical protein ATCC90586_004425 [Pythium insidiosum]|nr:hypothetical protein ATCC90586_004425 [Pythium insidiosum]
MSRIFVGHLPNDVKERQLQEYFAKFGPIASFMLRFLHRAAPFAFIEFRSADDALRAVREADGRYFESSRMRVEISEGHDALSWPQTTQHRVIVSNLPSDVTRRELQDLLQRGGDVVHVSVDKRGNGTASFATFAQMQRAIRRLDNTDVACGASADVSSTPAFSLSVPLSLSLSLAFSFSFSFSLAASIASLAVALSISISIARSK